MAALSSAIRSSFNRPVAPDRREIADLATPSCLASHATNTSFAAPSTGGDATRTASAARPSPCK